MPRFHYTPTTPDAGSIGDLMLRRGQIAGNRARTIGEIEAQAAMARGQIWGGTVAGIAGSVGDLISGYARQKAEAPARALEHATKTADLRLKETQIAEAGQKAKEREELSRQDRALLRLFGADQTQAEGLLEPGNIDLRAQPSVPNPDGGMSTVYSFSVNFDGKEYLLPRVTPDGRLLSEDDAISEFQQTGRHLGAFESPDHATKYASQLHEDYAAGRFNSQGPTPQDIIRVVGPQKGLAIIQGMKALADLQKGEVTDARDTAGRLALGLQQLSPALRKQAWPQIRELAIKAGLGDAETVPVEPSAEYLKAIVAWSTGKAPETPELMNVPPGGAVLDPTTREPVFTNPREVTPPNPTEASLAAAAAAGDQNAAEALRLLRAQQRPPQAPQPSYSWAKDPKTGEVVRATEEEIRAHGLQQPDTADMRNKEAGKRTAARAVEAVQALGSTIITKVGPAQRIDAVKRGAEAVFGNDPEFRTYQDSRMALAGTLAVEQQGSRVSDADVKALWLPMVPDAYRDTAESYKLKWDLIEAMRGVKGEASSEADDAYAAYLKRQGAGSAR